MRKEEYKKWVEKAFQYIEDVYDRVNKLEHVNVGSTQYIPKLDGDFEFVFLGHDAHEGRGEDVQLDITYAKERFYKGNGNPRCWRKLPEWKIWNNIESAFRNIGFSEIMDNDVISEEILNKTMVTNALLFNYSGKAKELNYHLKPDIVNDCMKLTGELLFDVIKPKMVICSSCSLVFEPLITNYKKNHDVDISYEVFDRLEGTRKKVMRCKYHGITVLGIPHTSYPVPKSVAAFVRDSYLGKENGCILSNHASQLNSVESNKPSSPPLNMRAKELKKIINNNGAIQKIFSGTVLFHEYFTTIVDNKYVDSEEKIAIDLMPEEKKDQYAILVFTRQKNAEVTKELIKGIWPNEDFNPWVKDKSRHVHKVIPFSYSNELIVEVMKQVLSEVKEYRDKTFSLIK